MRSATVIALAVLTAPAFAQTSPQLTPGTITAEAVELVRVKPDQAKVSITAVSRNNDPATASDETGEAVKRFADTVQRLRVKGLKISIDPVKVAKLFDERAALRGGFAPGGGAITEIQATQQMVLTISDPDVKTLVEAVEKVQREAIKEGLTGSVPEGILSSRSTSEMVKIAYLKQEGLDDLLAAALTKATKKATTRAEAIASGLGMKLGAVVAAEEVPTSTSAVAEVVTSTLTSSSRTSTPVSAELVEGELVRTVRVRVVYAVSK